MMPLSRPGRRTGDRCALDDAREVTVADGGPALRTLVVGDGPLVLLLHGFPDSPWSWRRQAGPLVDAGFRVAAPWLRGYGPSARPAGLASYTLDALAADAARLIDALGGGRAALVAGHDWGGAIACHAAARTPERIGRLAVLNAPHPAALATALRHPAQLVRSLYILFFQLPALPEALLRARDFRLVRRAVRRGLHRPAALTAEDWAHMRAAIEPPGALTAALDYYRAVLRRPTPTPPSRTPPPAALLWGDRDPFLGPELRDATARRLRATVRRWPEAGHWVQWEAPDEVAAALVEAARLGTGGGS